MKEGGDGSGELAGERIGEVSDKDLRGDMSKAGVSEKDIEEMSKASKDNKMSELSEDDVEMLQDLLVAAFNEALRKVSSEKQSAMGGLTGGFGF